MATYFLYPLPGEVHPEVKSAFSKIRVYNGLKKVVNDTWLLDGIYSTMKSINIDTMSKEAIKGVLKNYIIEEEVKEDIIELFGLPTKTINY